MKSKLIPSLLLLTGFLVGASALSALAQSTWIAAPGTPPDCPIATPGCNPPVNVSATLQEKLGPLVINKNGTAVDDIGLKMIGKLQIVDGNQGAGKVLTDTTGDGIGTWQTVGAFNSGFELVNYGTDTLTSPGGNNVGTFTFTDLPSNTPAVLVAAEVYSADTYFRFLDMNSRYIGRIGGVETDGSDVVSGFGGQLIIPLTNNSFKYHSNRDNGTIGLNIIAIVPLKTALGVGSISCTKSGGTYNFSGTASGGTGSYSYNLLFNGDRNGMRTVISKNQPITVPGSHVPTTEQTGYQYVSLIINDSPSTGNRASISCPSPS